MPNATPSRDTIFCEAIEIGDAADRAAYLAQACGGDDALRQRVEALVAAHFRAGSFMDRPADTPDVTADFAPGPEEPGTVIGPYKLLERIGEGGMGVVYVAEQTEPVRRRVALKVIKPGMDTKEVVARFEAERQALALMDHPHIAKVLDAGATAAGRPYFVMELVRGLPVTEYCDQARLPPDRRLRLFAQVCRAVQHAHQKGVIHRDLKPSNVLVTLHDGEPVPKVIDFGVAKAVNQRLTDKTVYTQLAQLIGTPLYMSPEQAELSGLDIDTRTDVYSLGVLLYELLTGTTPFDADTLRRAGFDEMRRMIREDEPARPSHQLSTLEAAARSTVSARRGLDDRQLGRLLRGDLDWLVMKALEKDRNRRYESAGAFAADVERYLADEPVEARPPSAAYRLRKFARRNKAGVAVATLALAMFAVMLSSIGWVAGDRGARRVRAEERVSEVLDAAEAQLADGNPHAGDLVRAVRQAEAEMESGFVGETSRQRLRQVHADMAMLKDLELARLSMTAVKDGHFDWEGKAEAYARAFRQYGIDVQALDSEAAVALVRERRIALHLATALDDWARELLEPRSLKVAEHLLTAACGADPDGWRNRLRMVLAAHEWRKLPDLARGAPVHELPATTLALLGRSLVEAGMHTEAVDLLRQAQGRFPADFWINDELANALMGSQPPLLEEAVGFLRAAVALRPESPGAHLNLGNALQMKGQLDEAIAACLQALRLKPDYADARLNLGNALSDKGQLDEAIAAYREALRLKPDYAAAYNNLGIALSDKGQLDEAIAAYREALRLKPDYAAAYNNLGIALGKKGQLDEAVAAYRQALRLKPDYAEAHSNLGNALSDKGQLDEAIAAYREALRLKPDYAEAHCSLGKALTDKGRHDEAILSLREALRLRQSYALAHLNLGVALANKRQLDPAAASFNDAIRVTLKRPPTRGWGLDKQDLAIAYRNLGTAQALQGKVEEAIASWREAVRSNPGDAYTQYSLAWFLATCSATGLRDPKQAVTHAEKAAALTPNDGHAWTALGVARYRNGDWKAAVEALTKSIKLGKGGDSSDFFFLAMAHWQLGDKEKARTWYDQALAWMDKNKPKDEELKRFRTEAAELLGLPNTSEKKK